MEMALFQCGRPHFCLWWVPLNPLPYSELPPKIMLNKVLVEFNATVLEPPALPIHSCSTRTTTLFYKVIVEHPAVELYSN